jgi:hypothetical protein
VVAQRGAVSPTPPPRSADCQAPACSAANLPCAVGLGEMEPPGPPGWTAATAARVGASPALSGGPCGGLSSEAHA